MPSVTETFARTMARAAGLCLTEDGALMRDGTCLHKIARTAGAGLDNADYFDLIGRIRAAHRDEVDLALAYARTVTTDDLGVLGLAIRTAPTLRQSLVLIERYYRLVTDSAVYCLEEDGDHAAFSLVGRTAAHPVLKFRNECALAALFENMRRFTGGPLTPDHVSFRHEARDGTDRYDAHFGCVVRFEAERDAIVLKRSDLDLANRLGDPGVCAFLSGHLDTEIAALAPESPHISPLTDDLLKYLNRALRDGAPSAAEVARALGMSERTLYRRLAEEGQTYRDVLQRAQTALARTLLASSDCSIAEVAFLTGFSEQSTFTRAFKRWVGQPPARFRQQTARV